MSYLKYTIIMHVSILTQKYNADNLQHNAIQHPVILLNQKFAYSAIRLFHTLQSPVITALKTFKTMYIFSFHVILYNQLATQQGDKQWIIQQNNIVVQQYIQPSNLVSINYCSHVFYSPFDASRSFTNEFLRK